MRIDGDRGISADRRLSAFVLVHSEVHAGAEQLLERAFHTFLPDEAFHVAKRASGVVQERTVRARKVRPDRPSHQIEEIIFAAFKPPPERRPGLSDGERIPEVGREAAKQPKPRDKIVMERQCVAGFRPVGSHSSG
jgi:hypothetical protein